MQVVPSWDDMFCDMLDVAASKSKDESTQVGALIINSDKVIKSTGFNGMPRGCNDSAPERHERPLKYKWFEHAERNAIYNAVRDVLKNHTIYVSWMPCTDCARAIIQVGIKRVILVSPSIPLRWKPECDISMEMFNEAGVFVSLRDFTTTNRTIRETNSIMTSQFNYYE